MLGRETLEKALTYAAGRIKSLEEQLERTRGEYAAAETHIGILRGNVDRLARQRAEASNTAEFRARHIFRLNDDKAALDEARALAEKKAEKFRRAYLEANAERFDLLERNEALRRALERVVADSILQSIEGRLFAGKPLFGVVEVKGKS